MPVPQKLPQSKKNCRVSSGGESSHEKQKSLRKAIEPDLQDQEKNVATKPKKTLYPRGGKWGVTKKEKVKGAPGRAKETCPSCPGRV